MSEIPHSSSARGLKPRPSLRLTGVFVTLALVLICTLFAAFWSGQRVLILNREIQGHHALIIWWSAALSEVQDAETGQRGFLLTGDEKYLRPYLEASRVVEGRMLPEASSTREEGELRQALHDKAAELAKTVELYKAGDHEGAIAMVKSDRGALLMDKIRGIIGQMRAREEAGLAANLSAAADATRERNWVFAAVALVNLLFLPWAYRRIQREIAARVAAQREGEQHRELMAVTLTSIGDAVIVTDTEARISFLNAVAEQLTGWSLAEALGRPCAEVFNIVQEETRAVVESPVAKVLRDGRIVGLANHTLLLRRDGTEVPIDDSGAPVRDAEGKTRGVVLVFRDFSGHKATERALRTAHAEVEAASRAKDRFLAALSHELRTPLTPVLAALSEWEQHEQIPEALRPQIGMLRRNVEFEAQLIDDLLDLTRIAKGKMNFRPERVDAHAVAGAAAAVVQEEIARKGLRLEVKLEAERYHLEADPVRLQQVFLNLLKNAAKFTPAGQILFASAVDPAGQLRMVIEDTGVGMPPEVIGKLFHFFEQGNDSVTRRFGGLGLGLAISHAIVQAHGGKLEAASAGEGQGSAFILTFPLIESEGGIVAVPEPRAIEIPVPPPLRILLVEDHADTSQVLQRLLRRSGHLVQGAGALAQAKALLAAQEFDLLSDLGLPDGSGLELIRSVRPGFDKPALALSGFGLDEDVRRCREAGFNAHLTKPVKFEALSEMLARLTSTESAAWHGESGGADEGAQVAQA